MKKVYQHPQVVVEEFAPNEYCSACGKTEYGKYLFNCDAPAGDLYYYNSRGRKRFVGQYHPCLKKHETDSKNDFVKGFVDRNDNQQEDKGEAATVWLERGFLYTNGHATTNLDQEHWEVLRS